MASQVRSQRRQLRKKPARHPDTIRESGACHRHELFDTKTGALYNITDVLNSPVRECEAVELGVGAGNA